jgi:hypothetical protein
VKLDALADDRQYTYLAPDCRTTALPLLKVTIPFLEEHSPEGCEIPTPRVQPDGAEKIGMTEGVLPLADFTVENAGLPALHA